MLVKIKYYFLKLKLFVYSSYMLSISSLATLFFFQKEEDIPFLINEIYNIYPNAELSSVTVVQEASANSCGLVDIVFKYRSSESLNKETEDFLEKSKILVRHLQNKNVLACLKLKENEK